MTPEQEEIQRAIFETALQLDLEAPNSPLARYVSYRVRRIFGHELDQKTGKLSVDGVYELELLTAVMYEQIALGLQDE